MEKVEFEIEYKRVFDENDEIRLCGREACKALIMKMEECFPGEVFGNPDTGFMDIFKIKRFYHRACSV